MSLWTILDTALDWICNWRFNVCFWGGIVLAVIVANCIPDQPLQWIAAGLVLISGVILGIRWDNSN